MGPSYLLCKKHWRKLFRPKEILSDGSADVQEGMNTPQRRNTWANVKVELFTDDIILYAENPKEFTIKTIRTNNRFGKVARYKLNIQKSIVFLYTSNEQWNKEKKSIYNSTKKREEI